MKNLFVLSLALMLSFAAAAKPVTPSRAALVADNFWRSLPSSTKSPVSFELVEWQYDGIYLFANTYGGYVMVAADDEVRPILGYSPSGAILPDNISPAMSQWLQGFQTQIERQRVVKSNSHVFAAEWKALEAGQYSSPKEGGVEPLIATLWNQGYPYNALCPAGTVTGCAATAQAQVMNFWHHPAFGNGSHSYTHATYGTQAADFAHTLYDWAGMPLDASDTSTDRERDAVATLMYHCGVSLEMNYGTAAQGGSSALGLYDNPDFPTINNALKDYFFYDPAMRVVFKDEGFTNDQWRDTMKAELDLGHPIVYTGQGSAGGHGFVCDGYDSRGYLHFNFGWSGVGDGYFPVDSITPGRGGVGGGSYSFNDYNSALLGLVPLYDLRVSDTISNIVRAGGDDSVLFCIDPTINTIMEVTCNADWLTVTFNDTLQAGILRFHASENNSGEERVAVITLAQGTHQCHVRVVQGAYDAEELCPLTVVMESTRGEGWQGGAYLSLESENGYVFGTATLADAQKDSVVILVAPHNVLSVWHSGGGTDRYINYYVRNQYGEDFVSAPYAYRTGGTHLIEWSCVHVGIEEVLEIPVDIYPNPTGGILHINAEGLQRVEVMDMTGRPVAKTHSNSVDLSRMPVGAYFVRVVTTHSSTVHRIVKK